MTHTDTPLQFPAEPTKSAILRQIAFPFFLFSAVLASLLLLSFFLLLPLFTKVEVGGVERSVSSLQSYGTRLTADVLTQVEKRNDAVLPLHDTDYDALKALRLSTSGFTEMRAMVLQEAISNSAVADSVHIDSVSLNSDTKLLTVTGDVRNVGPESMTLLAEFTDALKRLPFVKSLQSPQFIRLDNEATGPHSPFTLGLLLQ